MNFTPAPVTSDPNYIDLTTSMMPPPAVTPPKKTFNDDAEFDKTQLTVSARVSKTAEEPSASKMGNVNSAMSAVETKSTDTDGVGESDSESVSKSTKSKSSMLLRFCAYDTNL